MGPSCSLEVYARFKRSLFVLESDQWQCNWYLPLTSTSLRIPIAVMLNVLEADRSFVADIEAKIQDLERSISALRIAKMSVQERLNAYKYPVLTLPNEIISEIFFHFLPAYPLFPPLTGLLSPTLLTQICREWREIALATPTLWSAIPISCSNSPQDFERHDIWLSRSNFCPLSIEIVEGRYVNCRPENLVAVIAQCARWEQLKIRLWAHSSLPTIEGPMSLLRHLDLVLKDHLRTANVIVCSVAPMLRSVILNDLAASKVILPWAQLTSLTLRTVYPRQCAPLLKQTPNLVHCELGLLLDDHDMDGAEIQLPCLESLTLKNKYQSMTDYLYAFFVPALRSLQVTERFLGTNPIEALTLFISKSGCQLQELSIMGEISVIKDLLEYRRAFPSIPKLSLNG
jgi:hypothetical protein